MDKKISDYIFENDANEKRMKATELLNESAEDFAEEQELENLLCLSFKNLDMSEKILGTVHQLEKNTNAKLSENVISSLKTRKRKRIIIWSISAAAAILFLSFVLMNLGGRKHFEIKLVSADKNLIIENPDGSQTVKQGSTVKGAVEIKFPKGVYARSFEDTVYRFTDSNSEFLILEEGEMDISVQSRKGKTPLYFKMPHASVKVIGTSFIIRCDGKSSEVTVREGVVELVTAHGSERVSAGETRTSLGLTDLETVPEPAGKWKFSFESLKEGIDYLGFPELVAGKKGKCLKFDGTTSAALFRNRDIEEESISFWLKIENEFTPARSILSQHDKKGSVNGFHIYLLKDKLFLQFKDKNKSHDRSTVFEKNKWHHLVFSRSNDGRYSLYSNSVLIFSGDFKYSYNSDYLNIGKSPDDFWKPFEGYLDELRVFDRVLSPEEVKNLYQQK